MAVREEFGCCIYFFLLHPRHSFFAANGNNYMRKLSFVTYMIMVFESVMYIFVLFWGVGKVRKILFTTPMFFGNFFGKSGKFIW